MDNASEALRIAGAVLIGVMLLALLIAFFNNLSSYTKVKDKVLYDEQVVEFNKQFDMYIRDEIYGSDVLSLVNKAADYNVREVDNKGYIRLDIKIKFKNTYGILQDEVKNNKIFEANNTYTANQIIDNMNRLEEKIKSVGKITYKGHKVKELALMYDTDLEILFENIGIKDKINEAKEKINYYLILKSDETTIKSAIYECKTTKYDDKTERITMIEYIQK